MLVGAASPPEIEEADEDDADGNDVQDKATGIPKPETKLVPKTEVTGMPTTKTKRTVWMRVQQVVRCLRLCHE